MLLFPNNLIAEDTIPKELIKKEYTKQELINKVYQYSEIHNQDPIKVKRTIDCENRDWDIDLQSLLTYKAGNRWGFAEGTYEKSYGLAQIHLPDHPDITYEQATDPDFAINYMAEHLGRDVTWSCYKKPY